MISESIDLSKLAKFVVAAFDGDEDIIDMFDKDENVKDTDDVISSVIHKIKSQYSDSSVFGLYDDNDKNPIGFFVVDEDEKILISFGLNIGHRKDASCLFEEIKKVLGDEFNCMLYSYNKRAIKWLEKMGMKVIVKNISILQLCQSQQEQ